MTEYLLLLAIIVAVPFVLTKSPFSYASSKPQPQLEIPSNQFILDSYIVYSILLRNIRYFPGHRPITVFTYPPTSIKLRWFLLHFLGYLPSRIAHEMERNPQHYRYVLDDTQMRNAVETHPYSIGYTNNSLLINDGNHVHEVTELPYIIEFDD